MNFKPLALLVISTTFLTACGIAPTKKEKIVEPFVFKEPDPTPPFYALNPIKYDAPPSCLYTTSDKDGCFFAK